MIINQSEHGGHTSPTDLQNSSKKERLSPHVQVVSLSILVKK